MNHKVSGVASVVAIGLILMIGGAQASIKLPASEINKHWQLAKVQSEISTPTGNTLFALADTSFKGEQTASGAVRHKSPAKAFALSMLVPGLGQLYNGNKFKAVTFLGIEATAWILEFKWHSDGNKLTKDFEAFHDAHWSEGQYSTFLQDVYGFSDDDSIDATEISHHLPDTKTQQYYEMTGKYDQFSWGWDDAMLNNHGFNYYADTGTFLKAVYPDVPVSANRSRYESMRYDANKKFSNARKMIMLALGNRLVSALEAFISAKKSQITRPASGKGASNPEFSHWKVQGRLKSVYARYDTPYLKVTYGF